VLQPIALNPVTVSYAMRLVYYQKYCYLAVTFLLDYRSAARFSLFLRTGFTGLPVSGLAPAMRVASVMRPASGIVGLTPGIDGFEFLCSSRGSGRKRNCGSCLFCGPHSFHEPIPNFSRDWFAVCRPCSRLASKWFFRRGEWQDVRFGLRS